MQTNIITSKAKLFIIKQILEVNDVYWFSLSIPIPLYTFRVVSSYISFWCFMFTIIQSGLMLDVVEVHSFRLTSWQQGWTSLRLVRVWDWWWCPRGTPGGPRWCPRQTAGCRTEARTDICWPSRTRNLSLQIEVSNKTLQVMRCGSQGATDLKINLTKLPNPKLTFLMYIWVNWVN